MKGKIVLVAVFFALFADFAGCIFGPAKFKGVIGYRPDGRVFIQHDRYYRVGVLPSGWQAMKTKARAISFYNSDYKSSISTDAFCGRDVTDRKLETLGGEMITALEGRSVLYEKNFDLDGRGAVRQKLTGSLDGVSVVVDLVVVRKNGCVFDFYAVMPPNNAANTGDDFENFFGAFHYE